MLVIIILIIIIVIIIIIVVVVIIVPNNLVIFANAKLIGSIIYVSSIKASLIVYALISKVYFARL